MPAQGRRSVTPAVRYIGFDSPPKRDGIAEILESGEFPGVVVSGDPNHVPKHLRKFQGHLGTEDPDRVERAYQRDIEQKRALVKERGRRRGPRMTHSIPSELYFGKIAETGDKAYWDDPKNRDRHKDCKVS